MSVLRFCRSALLPVSLALALSVAPTGAQSAYTKRTFAPSALDSGGTDRESIVVVGEGLAVLNDDPAAAEEEAVWDAKRNAVEQAAGLFVRSYLSGRDFQLEEDEIRGRSDGFVRQWEIVPGSRRVETIGGSRILRLQVRATVALLPVIRRLSDIADVYNDLERPRIRVEIEGDGPAQQAQDTLIAAFKAQGFEIASAGPAEITLAGRLEILPTLRLGDKNTPYGLGETVAACRAKLTLRVLSHASEEVLLAANAEGAGSSFQSDSEARDLAARQAASRLLARSADLFVQNLLVRWTQERQEGYVVVIQAAGLDTRHADLLREQLREMRGYRRTLSETSGPERYELRFLTRLDTRSLRRRLNGLCLDRITLTVQNQRGPFIACKAK